MTGYKLTKKNMQTYNNFSWELNVAKVPKPTDYKEGLCGPGWLHFYPDPLLAVLMNPFHADIDDPRLFECECEGEIIHESLKSGCTKMTLVKELDVPKITLEQRVRFAILCALEVYQEEYFVNWASKWLDGTDHSKEAAEVVSAYAAEVAAAYVAKAAAYAACAAAYAEDAYAVFSAAGAADCAADRKKDIDFIKLAKQALES